MVLCFTSGPGHVPHRNIPAQLSQGGGSEGRFALRGAGQSSHCRWIRTLQQPHGLQHQPPQYGQPLSWLTACSWWSAALFFLNKGFSLVVFYDLPNWQPLHLQYRPPFNLLSSVSAVIHLFVSVCGICSRWPSEVGAGPAASHHRLGLRGPGGHCCLGGYRCCLP